MYSCYSRISVTVAVSPSPRRSAIWHRYFDVTVQAHCAGSPISTAAALHIEAAIPNFCIHEHHFRSTQPDLTRLCKYDYQPVKGIYTVPELPGLGQEMTKDAMDNALMHVTVDRDEKGL